LTSSHYNKRFRHIPTQQGMHAAYCAALATGSACTERTTRGTSPVDMDKRTDCHLSTGTLLATLNHSHPKERTRAMPRLRIVTGHT
jgi:hypothetical protein